MKRVLCFILIFLQIFLSGCIQKKEPIALKNREYLAYSIENLPEDLLMLHKGVSKREEDILCSLFDGLVELNEKGAITPCLAESWKITEDKLGYIFKLREDIYWSNGKSIEAQDFVDFFREILNPSSNNDFAEELFCIYGAKDYNKGIKQSKELAVMAMDKNTLQIRLNFPQKDFLKILCKPRYRIRKDFSRLREWKNDTNDIIFSGAFKINNFKKDNQRTFLQMVKNDKYYNYNNISISKIEINFLSSPEMSMANLDTENIDFFFNPPLSEFDRIMKKYDINYFTSDNLFTAVFNFNSPLASSVEFRTALKQIIMESVYRERFAEINEVCNGEFCYNKNRESNRNVLQVMKNHNKNYDLKLAENILKNFDMKDIKALRFIGENNFENKIILNNIQESLKNNNLSIKYELFEGEEFKEALKKQDYDIAFKNYNIDIGNRMSFFREWYKNDRTIISYKNKQYESMINEVNLNKIEETNINKIEKILKDDIPIIPLYFRNTLLCSNRSVKDIYFDGNGNVVFKRMYKVNVPKADKNKDETIKEHKEEIKDNVPIGMISP